LLRRNKQTPLSLVISLAILLSVKHDMCMMKNKSAQALGKLGGKARANALSAPERSAIAKQGATARASKLSAAERSEIARKAVQARIAKQAQQKGKEGKA
jgi:hypothetical protein